MRAFASSIRFVGVMPLSSAIPSCIAPSCTAACCVTPPIASSTGPSLPLVRQLNGLLRPSIRECGSGGPSTVHAPLDGPNTANAVVPNPRGSLVIGWDRHPAGCFVPVLCLTYTLSCTYPSLLSPLPPFSPLQVPVGSIVQVTLQFTLTDDSSNVILLDLPPAGLEPLDDRLQPQPMGMQPAFRSSKYDE